MDLGLYHSFGMNCDISRNVTFYNDNALIFAAGKLTISLDINTRQQKIIPIIEGQEITVISRCEEQLALAIKGRPPFICLLNITSDSTRFYHSPVKMKSDKYLCVSVSTSHKFVAAQGSSPDWKLVIWLATTREIVFVVNPTSKRQLTAVREISFHGGGREEVVVVGKNVFRLYEYQADQEEISFKEIVFDKFEVGDEFCSITWPQKETLAVSTLSGKVLFFRGIEFVREIVVSNDVTEEFVEFTSVTCLACTAKEIFCTFAGTIVAVYKGEEVPQYTLNRLIILPAQKRTRLLPGKLKSNDDVITHMDLSPSNGFLVVSTGSGQLLYCDLRNEAGFRQYFHSLVPRQHARPIRAMDVARGRPLVATTSKHCVILWNYKTGEQELFLYFKDTLTCLALHPSGLYLALGFTLYTRMCTILYNGLKERQVLELKNCSRIVFAYGGHMFALAKEAVIDVYDFMSAGKLARLAGHAGRVAFLAWKENDTRLVSCDVLGVICEWDVATWTKLWENTDTVSYSCMIVTPNRNIIAVIPGKGFKCVADGSVQWEFGSQDELSAIVVRPDGETYYGGTKDGSLARYTLPSTGLKGRMQAHIGEVNFMMFSPDFRILFTVSVGGLLFGWRCEDKTEDASGGFSSNVVLVDVSDLKIQKEKEDLLRMSLKQCHIAYEYDLKLNKMKHEETKRAILVDHENVVLNLNNEIADLKERIQDLVFESSPSIDLQELEGGLRKRMLEQAEQLAHAYERTSRYVDETREIVQKHEDALKSAEGDYAEASADVKEREEAILGRIKDLETEIMKEREVTQNHRNSFEDEKKRFKDEEEAQEKTIMETDKHRLESEKHKTEELESELKRLRQMKLFVQKDNQRKQNEVNGQINLDIEEKYHSIQVLEEKLHGLHKKLISKDKVAQTQDLKFFEARKQVGDLQRGDSISKNETKILKTEMKSTEKEIDSCKAEIKEITQSVPALGEEIRLVKDQCSTLGRKLRETVDGFGDKQKLLRHNQSIMSRYKSLLYQSRSQNSDAIEVKNEILQLFDQIEKGTEETLDPDLKKEFEHQIRTLQQVYKDIKSDPAKSNKDLSLAEFKLSQENAQLLKEVHGIEQENEGLRDKIFEMEVAMGMPFTRQAKITKEVDELRNKIELVVRCYRSKDVGSERKREIERLEKLIEEQEDEIERLQAMLQEKTGKK